ncbi:hypothetical protein GCM10009646_28710 [Streptomyces aureus]
MPVLDGLDLVLLPAYGLTYKAGYGLTYTLDRDEVGRMGGSAAYPQGPCAGGPMCG